MHGEPSRRRADEGGDERERGPELVCTARDGEAADKSEGHHGDTETRPCPQTRRHEGEQRRCEERHGRGQPNEGHPYRPRTRKEKPSTASAPIAKTANASCIAIGIPGAAATPRINPFPSDRNPTA